MARKLVLATSVFKRPIITEFFFRYWKDQKDRLDFDLVLWAALSPEDPYLYDFERLCGELGWNYAVVPNNPLWRKWNDLMQAIRSSPSGNCDGLMVMGSDDIATPSFTRAIWALIRSGVDYIQPTGCIMFEPESGRMSFLSAFSGGAGRAFSAKAIMAMDWALWEENVDLKSVDIYQQQAVRRLKGLRHADLPITAKCDWHIMDIKSTSVENMWDWEQFSPNNNILCYWLDATPTLEANFPGYFEGIEEEVDA